MRLQLMDQRPALCTFIRGCIGNLRTTTTAKVRALVRHINVDTVSGHVSTPGLVSRLGPERFANIRHRVILSIAYQMFASSFLILVVVCACVELIVSFLNIAMEDYVETLLRQTYDKVASYRENTTPEIRGGKARR